MECRLPCALVGVPGCCQLVLKNSLHGGRRDLLLPFASHPAGQELPLSGRAVYKREHPESHNVADQMGCESGLQLRVAQLIAGPYACSWQVGWGNGTGPATRRKPASGFCSGEGLTYHIGPCTMKGPGKRVPWPEPEGCACPGVPA